MADAKVERELRVREALEEIEQREGRLEPAMVVERAKDDERLHDEFLWDDSEAAYRYRLEQARGLIRSIRFEVTVEDVSYRVPNYLRNLSKPTDSYVALSRVKRDADQARRNIEAEIARIEAAIARAMSVAVGLDVQGYFAQLFDAAVRAREDIKAALDEARAAEERRRPRGRRGGRAQPSA